MFISSLYDAAFAMNQLKIYDILNRYDRRGSIEVSKQSSGDTFNVKDSYNTTNVYNTSTVNNITYNIEGKINNNGKKS
jgi:hypothetical protein